MSNTSYHNYIIRIELDDVKKIIPKSNHTLDIYQSLHKEMDRVYFQNEIQDLSKLSTKDYHILPRAMYYIMSDSNIDIVLSDVLTAVRKAFEDFSTIKQEPFSVVIAGQDTYRFYNLDPAPAKTSSQDSK